MAEKYIKLVMLGEGRVGKTSLTIRYCMDQFDDDQVSTVNASYLEKKVTMPNNEEVKLAIWDTAGQEKFNALAPMYYRDAVGAIVVYDITFKESFDRVNKWIEELRQFAKKDIVVCIAGNKCDQEINRKIKKEDADEYARRQGCKHFSTSAKANIGVDEIFKYLTSEIVAKMSKKNPRGRKMNVPMIRPVDEDGQADSPRNEGGRGRDKGENYEDDMQYNGSQKGGPGNNSLRLDPKNTKKKAPTDKKCC